jgi:hypothetical protein
MTEQEALAEALDADLARANFLFNQMMNLITEARKLSRKWKVPDDKLSIAQDRLCDQNEKLVNAISKSIAEGV